MVLGKKMNQGHNSNEPSKITRLSAIYIPNRIAYHYLKNELCFKIILKYNFTFNSSLSMASFYSGSNKIY